MIREGSYLDIKEPWNIGLKYILNDYVSFDLQHLHGSQISLTAQVAVNPNRPPLLGEYGTRTGSYAIARKKSVIHRGDQRKHHQESTCG